MVASRTFALLASCLCLMACSSLRNSEPNQDTHLGVQNNRTDLSLLLLPYAGNSGRIQNSIVQRTKSFSDPAQVRRLVGFLKDEDFSSIKWEVNGLENDFPAPTGRAELQWEKLVPARESEFLSQIATDLVRQLEGSALGDCETIGLFKFENGFAVANPLIRTSEDGTHWKNVKEKCFYPSHAKCALGYNVFDYRMIGRAGNCFGQLIRSAPTGYYTMLLFVFTDEQLIIKAPGLRARPSNLKEGALAGKEKVFDLWKEEPEKPKPGSKLHLLVYSYEVIGTLTKDKEVRPRYSKSKDACRHMAQANLFGLAASRSVDPTICEVKELTYTP